jgi:hypothetical protein
MTSLLIMSVGRTEANGIIYECFETNGTNRRAEAIGPTSQAGNELYIREFVALHGKKFPVKKIEGFEGWNGVKVTIPNSVEEIGDRCFYECYSLREVVFGAEPMLQRIVDTAFHGCDLTSAAFPSYVCVVNSTGPTANAKSDSERDRTEDMPAAHQ